VTTWTRAVVDMLCGACPRQIRRGDPVLEIRVAGVTRTPRRCQSCAGEAPPDLPPLVVTSPAPATRPEGISAIAARVAPDFKQRQLGEDN